MGRTEASGQRGSQLAGALLAALGFEYRARRAGHRSSAPWPAAIRAAASRSIAGRGIVVAAVNAGARGSLSFSRRCQLCSIPAEQGRRQPGGRGAGRRKNSRSSRLILAAVRPVAAGVDPAALGVLLALAPITATRRRACRGPVRARLRRAGGQLSLACFALAAAAVARQPGAGAWIGIGRAVVSLLRSPRL